MDKRLFTALALSILIVLGWSLLFPPKRDTAPATPPAATTTDANAGGAATNAGTTPTTPPAPEKPTVSPVVADTAERTEVVAIGPYRAVFSNRGGVLAELRTRDFVDRARLETEEAADWKHWMPLVSTIDDPSSRRAFSLRAMPSTADLVRAPLEDEFWTMAVSNESPTRTVVTFTLAPGQGVTFQKRFTFDLAREHRLRFEFTVANDALANVGGARSFLLTPAAGVPNTSGDSYYYEPQAVAYAGSAAAGTGTLKVEPFHADGGSGPLPAGTPLTFAGVYNKYFAVLLTGADDAARASLAGATWRAVRDPAFVAAHPDKGAHAWHQIETDVEVQIALPAQGQSRTLAYDVYAGPKRKAALEAASPDFLALTDHDLGFVSGISKLLLWILGLFHSLTSSWGLAIVLLTISVRALLFPINRRSQTAMGRYQAKIKRLQPKIDELKKRFENDPTRLRQEQAKLMQSEDALMPPLGGCLPPLLQIPIFIGLYRALGVSFDLRQTPFLGWIHDLSLPDRLIAVDFHLPLFGTHVTSINVLPPIMVVAWILQQRAMPKPTDEQALLMYKMMMFMPIVMGIFLYNYAAGLSLYMITQSVLGIVEQRVIKKYWPIDDKELPKKPKKRGFLQRLMEEQEKRLKDLEARKKTAARR